MLNITKTEVIFHYLTPAWKLLNFTGMHNSTIFIPQVRVYVCVCVMVCDGVSSDHVGGAAQTCPGLNVQLPTTSSTYIRC